MDKESFIFSEIEPITVKSPATLKAQIEKLVERGLIIDDMTRAERTLETINYYRLVHYFAVFLDVTGENYKIGTKFTDAIRLYEFDRRLRIEILAALEEIEIAVRAAVSNHHVLRYGAIGYLNTDSFDRKHNHKVFMGKVNRIIDKNAGLNFVRHHNTKYGGYFPLWVLMEMFSFGMLVIFFQDLKHEDKKKIAKKYYKQDCRNIEKWIEELSDLRNHCAHYNRVYGNPVSEKTTLFDYLLMMKRLHKEGVKWGKSFATFMELLLDEYSDIVNPRHLGFPNGWVDDWVNAVENVTNSTDSEDED